MKTIVTKQEFAARKNRKPSAISNWIAAGKISPAALIGVGRRARIWLEQAESDLAGTLTPSQQWPQKFPANQRTAPADAGGPAPVIASDLEIDRGRRAKADADRSEYEAEALRHKLLLEKGKFMLTNEAEAALAKIAYQTMAIFESALVDLAAAIASKYSLPQRDVLHVLRAEFRKVRARVAAGLREEQAKVPETKWADTKELVAESSVQDAPLVLN